MNYEKLNNLIDGELEKVAALPALNENAVALLYKLVDIKKDICEIKDKEVGGYSNRKMMGWYDDGVTPQTNGNSYAYYNHPPIYYDNGYSRNSVVDHLQMALNNAVSDKEREAIRRAMMELESH